MKLALLFIVAIPLLLPLILIAGFFFAIVFWFYISIRLITEFGWQ